jgi:hypothetical protein
VLTAAQGAPRRAEGLPREGLDTADRSNHRVVVSWQRPGHIWATVVLADLAGGTPTHPARPPGEPDFRAVLDAWHSWEAGFVISLATLAYYL